MLSLVERIETDDIPINWLNPTRILPILDSTRKCNSDFTTAIERRSCVLLVNHFHQFQILFALTSQLPVVCSSTQPYQGTLLPKANLGVAGFNHLAFSLN